MKIINQENVPQNASPDQMVDKEGTTHGPVETIQEADVNPIEITKVMTDAHVRKPAEITQTGDGPTVVPEITIDHIRNKIDRTRNANSTTDRTAIAETDQIPVADHATNVMAWGTFYLSDQARTGTKRTEPSTQRKMS